MLIYLVLLTLFTTTPQAGEAQQRTSGDVVESAKRLNVEVDRLIVNYKACMATLEKATSVLIQCDDALKEPRLPLGVQVGECYRIGADMSLIQIACPQQ